MALEEVWMLAPDLKVLREDGEFALSSFWEERSTVVYFLRHFGCPLCKAQLQEVQEKLPGFEKRGIQVIAVGQGTGSEAANFCGGWGAEFACVGDPTRVVYAEYGMRRGSWWTVLLRQLLTDPIRALRLLFDADMAGLRLTSTDVMQLPGVALVESGGTMRALHVAQASDDMPSPEEVWEVIDRLALDLPFTSRRLA